MLRHTETSAEQIRIRIEGLMNARMASLGLLAERWVERTPPDFSPERFYQFAEAIYAHYPGFFAINWIDPEGAIQWIFPERDVPEKGRPIYEIDDSRYKEIFDEVRRSRIVGTTPTSDRQGSGNAFHVFLPLIHRRDIQGYLDGVFRLQQIMDVALARDILKNFLIRIYENNQIVYTNGNPDGMETREGTGYAARTIRFPGKTWRLELEHREMIKTTWSLINIYFLTFGFAISTALSLILYFLIQRMDLYRKARDHALREIAEREKIEETLKKKEVELGALLSEIEAKNEELETFVYTVSHDLKTPIVTIEGFIGAFREDFGDGLTAEGDSYLNYISDATRKMDTLINDLLELSRIGRLTETMIEFSFGDLVLEILANFRPLIQEKGIRVHVEENLPQIKGERKRIVQVMENLISNAIKYMGPDNPSPTIEIGARSENGRDVFYIQDNGIGIDHRYHDTIFQVFQRLPQAKKIDGGTGVGLTTAQRIIEHHGGKIWLDSEPGKGTTFFFTIHDREI